MANQTFNLFSIPLFEIEVPQMHQYHDELLDFFEDQIHSGKIKPHENGYGYQTPVNLFGQGAYPFPYLREILAKTFNQTCLSILQDARIDMDAKKQEWYNVGLIGWATMQTNETWPNNAWHTHLPATLSGCYYVNTSDDPNEGNFHVQNPMMENIFQPTEISFRPKAGHMLIFPSFLRHRPALSPNNSGRIRLAFCMDGHYALRFGANT